MKNLAKIGAIALMFCLTAAPAHAQDNTGDAAAYAAPAPISAAEKLEALKHMSPEERKAAIAERREALKNMSPEEREAAKAERKAAFQNLSEEQKQQIKAAMKERGGAHGFKGRARE